MTLPGLLIEYLISGAIALIWLAPLLARDVAGFDAVQGDRLILLAIALYVVGMVIDFLAYWLVRPLKGIAYRRARSKYLDVGSKPVKSSVEREIQLALYAPEVAKQVTMRSSRDRIARGAIVNALIAFLLEVLNVNPTTIGASLWLPLVILLVVVWWAFQYMSFVYEIQADLALQDKLKRP